MVGLLMIWAVVPVAGSPPNEDNWYEANGTVYPINSQDTCHSDTSCPLAPSDRRHSFHNDNPGGATVWAINELTGDVDYWQCIEPGLYSGNPTHAPSQGSTNGWWIHTSASTYLGDLEWMPGEDFIYEWYEGCFVPCEGILPGVPDPRCILITPFKVDDPET